MTPLDAANGFATIVGLIGLFKSERKATADASKEEFTGWLEAHKHEEIKRLVVENGAIGMAIDKMLRDQHGEVMRELAELNNITTGLAHNLASLSGLAAAVDSAAPQLSEQAVSILRQFNEADASKAIQLRTLGGQDYTFADGEGGIEVTEERFLDDDIQALVDLGLLLLDYNSRGDNVITITRAGAALGKQPASAEE